MLGALLSALGNLITSGVLQYLALKAVLITLFITVLPILLNNLFKEVIDGYISIATSHIGPGLPGSAVWQLSGIAAYLAGVLNVPASLSLILSAVAYRVSLRLIPFVRLG